jgi:polypyrimidine tract-binding protein 1
MQDALHCSVAQMNLQHVPVNGRHLEIEVSSQKQSSVGKPNEEGVARDFHDMPTYNRHKNDKVSKMYPPSSALHLSNMPDNTSPDEVLAVLRAAGAQVRNFKFLDNLNHIAVVLCTSLDNAVKVICTAHNVPIGTPSRLLRVGFGAFRP